jgi:hypothetical protein
MCAEPLNDVVVVIGRRLSKNAPVSEDGALEGEGN